MIRAADPGSGADHHELDDAQTARLARLTEPYHAMGERFPGYAPQTTREEMQRLVIKDIDIDDG